MIGAARRAVAGLAVATIAGPAPAARAEGGALSEEGRVVRIAAGPTYLHETWNPSDRSAAAVHTGWGPALDVAVGEFVLPRIVLGGSLHLAGIINRDETTAGVTYRLVDTIHFVDTFVAMIDFYPKPIGLHEGGGLGITAVTEVDTHMGSTQTTFGLAGEAHVGYERFVARRWSVGGLLRLSVFHYLADTPAPPASSIGTLATLLAAFTYH